MWGGVDLWNLHSMESLEMSRNRKRAWGPSFLFTLFYLIFLQRKVHIDANVERADGLVSRKTCIWLSGHCRYICCVMLSLPHTLLTKRGAVRC